MKEEALKLADKADGMAIEIPADWSNGEPKNVMTDIADMIRKLVEEIDCLTLTAQHHEFMARHLGMIVKERQKMMKPLSDEEIYALWCDADPTEYLPEMRMKDGSINTELVSFVRLIEERHGIK